MQNKAERIVQIANYESTAMNANIVWYDLFIVSVTLGCAYITTNRNITLLSLHIAHN